jgi:Carboxypeptidase regulatory-like domain
MIESLICIAFLTQQPAPPLRTVTSVQGTVVNALTGQSLRKATVILRSSDTENGISYAEEADSNGNFSIEDLQPGEYTVTAERQSYYLQPSGAPGAPAPRLKIAAGDRIEHLLIKMAPASSISGRVVDQDGDPVRGATVRVMQYFYVAGRRELRPGIQVQTRDDGQYRLFNLRPGRWFIQVTARAYGQNWVPPTRGPRPAPAPATSFYPGTRDAASATPVELHSGDDLRGYDVTMLSEAAYTIRFTPPAGTYTSMAPQIFYRDGTRLFSQTMGTAEDHQMQFMDVLPGSYTIIVSRDDGTNATYARTDVDVSNADVDLGVLDFQPVHDLSGKVKVEGGQARGLENLRVNLQAEGATLGRPANTNIKPDGNFAMKGITPGAYRVQVTTGPASLYLKSIRVGDQVLVDQRLDLTKPSTEPLTIVLGADVGEIEGSVKKASGEPSIHARMTLFPVGANADRGDLFRFVFSDEQGQFKFKSVAPGEYKLFAWEDVLGGMPQDPEFRKRFEKQSIAVKVAPNGHEKVDVTSISVAAASRDVDR